MAAKRHDVWKQRWELGWDSPPSRTPAFRRVLGGVCVGDVYTLTGVSAFAVCTVCRAQCKSLENKSAQPTDQGCHSTSCAVDTGSARQSALLCPRWPSAAGSGSHRSPRDLASQQPTSMQVAWVSNGTRPQRLSTRVLPTHLATRQLRRTSGPD